MKSRRIPLESDVEKYEVGKGMEDGFELFSDVVTKGWIVTDSLVKIKRADGAIMCPYIKHRRGRTFIGEGDYIVSQARKRNGKRSKTYGSAEIHLSVFILSLLGCNHDDTVSCT